MYLSYLMGADSISEQELVDLGIVIAGKKENGHMMLQIPPERLTSYMELVRVRLSNGFWNEIVGQEQIFFTFKFKDGSIKEYQLPRDSEQEIGRLCMEFNNEPVGKTDVVYKYLSENSFYHDFMLEHYADKLHVFDLRRSS